MDGECAFHCCRKMSQCKRHPESRMRLSGIVTGSSLSIVAIPDNAFAVSGMTGLEWM